MRPTVTLLLVAAALAVPASAQAPVVYAVGGPFLAVTPKGGVLILVKGGNEHGRAFVDHRVVFLIAKSRFVTDDVNGDGAMNQLDFTRGDKVRARKKAPPGLAPSGPDPQKVGGATIENLSHPPPPAG